MGPQKKQRKWPSHTKVWHAHEHRKRLIKHYADINGMSQSAFLNHTFNEWLRANNK